MNPTERAALLLLEARRTGIRLERLPEDASPADAAAAYAIQDRMTATLQSELGRTGGWKVGSKGRTDQPLCAPMPSGLFQASPGSLDGGAFKTRIIEAEVAFHIAADLPPIDRPYETEDVVDAIDYIVPAIEVVESRYTNFRSTACRWWLTACRMADSSMASRSMTGKTWTLRTPRRPWWWTAPSRWKRKQAIPPAT